MAKKKARRRPRKPPVWNSGMSLYVGSEVFIRGRVSQGNFRGVVILASSRINLSTSHDGRRERRARSWWVRMEGNSKSRLMSEAEMVIPTSQLLIKAARRYRPPKD